MIKRETELEETLRKGLLVDEVEGTRWCGWRLPEVRKTVGIGEFQSQNSGMLVLDSPFEYHESLLGKDGILIHDRDRDVFRYVCPSDISYTTRRQARSGQAEDGS